MSVERRNSGNAIADKSMDFAVRVVNLYRQLVSERNEYVMSRQLLRSGTSIGANVREAMSAQTKADFVAKMSIALKECNETGYWLELMTRTSFMTDEQYRSLDSDRREIFALLTSIIKSARYKG